ncbi:hypothetical protein DYB37_008910 [Aphanomyces astaci]|uniref:Sof1-like protein domain-containing protein n=1 Tax=Aphanomyces astaci TaxID=112090 RepID=A0A397DCN5_APHAT|nr:hypothetical protein DYB36_006323 [Aphanomyces astaci]RHY62144.1 hypothetical protein DYB38_007089 [Aphanomyces astaci]RHY88673.1 hypothetical protein DYB35_008476 [Aphanomyces astaci]RHZ12437.1 hypothetical protein DYB26_005414 [Aphanomyces astaci]RHZ15353.1 hypothetical protein DYB37_008910 [Aphanomyces astaci]
MKVKTISRVEQTFTQELATDRTKIHRNFDPKLHPFERPREYTRALNAVKLDKLFAKPFVGALDGHCDSVSCFGTSNKSLVQFVSGACDGEIRLWDLPRRKCVWSVYGHAGFVRGLTVAPDGNSFFSCSEDKTIKQWRMAIANEDDAPEAIQTFHGKESFMGIDHHWTNSTFATCSSVVQVWDHNRSDPIHNYSWGADSITSVNLLASTGSDRAVALYDTRLAQSMRKIVMDMRNNALAWNPMEPYHFTVANEDHNLYTFDMRNLDRALMIHKDHVSAVMDIAYSPTGKEFVSGSYDRSIRIFNVRSSKSREVYHTKRMQRIFAVKFSADAKFVLSGSDDTNIRIWKAQASRSLGKLNPRERKKLEYNDALKKRYQHLTEVKRIAKHRHVPKAIKKATAAKQEVKERETIKLANVRKHSKPGKVPLVDIRKKSVIRQIE